MCVKLCRKSHSTATKSNSKHISSPKNDTTLDKTVGHMVTGKKSVSCLYLWADRDLKY